VCVYVCCGGIPSILLPFSYIHARGKKTTPRRIIIAISALSWRTRMLIMYQFVLFFSSKCQASFISTSSTPRSRNSASSKSLSTTIMLPLSAAVAAAPEYLARSSLPLLGIAMARPL
jgi:hypothetical protein